MMVSPGVVVVETTKTTMRQDHLWERLKYWTDPKFFEYDGTNEGRNIWLRRMSLFWGLYHGTGGYNSAIIQQELPIMVMEW